MNEFFTSAGIAGAIVATLGIGGIIALYISRKLNPFMELIKTTNVISNLKHELSAVNEELAVAKKNIQKLTEQNRLLRLEIEQHKEENTILRDAIRTRDNEVAKLTDKVKGFNYLLEENNKVTKDLERKVRNHKQIMEKREQRIFDFLEKHIDPNAEDFKFYLRLDEPESESETDKKPPK